MRRLNTASIQIAGHALGRTSCEATLQGGCDRLGHVAALDRETVDRLFQLPITEFTPARNNLSAALKKSGETDKAEWVKSLAKPPLSAWVANQLYWRHRTAFDQL